MRATLWPSIIAVAVASFAFKAAGPALLGQQEIPIRASRAISVLAPVLLTALVVTDVAGPHWNDLRWPVLAGLAATAGSRLLKAPPLAAVGLGMAVTAVLRLIA
jgi:branched-subunit amino acid transport protein